MADENTSSAAVGTTAYDTQQQLEVVTNIKSSRTINTSDSITNHNNNTNNNNTSAGSDVNVSSKKRKADRWKQINLSKKEKSRISAEMKVKPLVIATGGLAPLFQGDIPLIQKIDDELTLKGLLAIHEDQKKK